MKRFFAGFICSAVLLANTTVFAESVESIQAVFGRVKVVVDGETVDKDTLLYDGTVYLPLRAAAEALNKDVTYDEASLTAYIVSPTPEPTPTPTPEPTPTPTPTPTPAPVPAAPAREEAKIQHASQLLDGFIDAGLPVINDRDIGYLEDEGIGNREYTEKILFKDARYGNSETGHGLITPEFEILIYRDQNTLLEALEYYIDRQGYVNVNPMFYHYRYYDNVLLLIPETVKFQSILEYERIFDEVVKP